MQPGLGTEVSEDPAGLSGSCPSSGGSGQPRDAEQRRDAERHATRHHSQWQAHGHRDAVAARRDKRARERDARAATLERSVATFDAPAARKFEELREMAAVDREEAARDRMRAAKDRAHAARERSRLEAELLSAHLDDLTGLTAGTWAACPSRMRSTAPAGATAPSVLAFVDVDDLKGINDRDGHSAGDQTLRTVVLAMRERLRSFDPIMRYGGDEFVAGMGGLSIQDAEMRFGAIEAMLEEHSGSRISVGLAALEPGESAEELTERADRLLLDRRNGRRGRRPDPE